MSDLAFGCSHTFGVGVKPDEAWPALLGLTNCGRPGCSADYIVRTAPSIINEYKPSKVYILWPNYSRFEYYDEREDRIFQSLPSDKNRILFMQDWTEEKLLDNFSNKVTEMKNFCKQHNIKLIDLTLIDLIPYIDNSDRWPISKLGHHYAPEWHRWVADIFQKVDNNEK